MRLHFVLLCLTLCCLGTLSMAAAPTLISVTPASGAIGQKVTLHGTYFTTATTVQFNGTAAVATYVSASYITTVVPVGATSGKISVRNAGGSASSATNFTVTVQPTITPIADQLINLGKSTAALTFTVGDAVTTASALTVTCVSSNSALVKPAGITLTGPDSSGICTVKVTPVATYSGQTAITLTVTNGTGLTAKTAFLLTVNRKPTISTLANQSIQVDQSTAALSFTVGDDFTLPAILGVSGESSNVTLLPAANIVFGGSGAARTVTLTPSAGQSGTSTITLTVVDIGGLKATSKFTLFVYAPPTITAIADQTLKLGAPSTASLAFTVGDSVTPAASLTVTGASSNPTLVANDDILLGGAGAARAVTVTPVSGQSGTTTITLTVTNGGGLTATTSFTVTVNASPMITAIADQLINMGTSTTALAFTVRDRVTPAAALTVTGISSNTSLIHAGGIVLTGPDAQGNCTITVTPVATYSGVTTITLTVTNGAGLTAKTSFVLTVNRPTISAIANQVLYVSTTMTPVPFTVGDTITPVADLTVTGASNNYALIPNANIVLGGSGTLRTVTVTPVAGKGGTATIILTVKDDAGLTATTRFSVTVLAKNPIDGADLVWVPGGSFTMGSLYGDIGMGSLSSSPCTQEVTLTGFWIYKYPVTVAQYLAFCDATGHPLPPWPGDQLNEFRNPWSLFCWSSSNGWKDPMLQQMPIVNVTWYDCKAYAAWTGGQLQTEAQYEYAARGPSEKNYPWGGAAITADPTNGWDQTKCANYCNSYVQKIGTWPVGSFPDGASWCGAQDLSGNVWEWCQDWFGDYSSTPVNNPTGPATGTCRVVRGNSWCDGEDAITDEDTYIAIFCRSVFRMSDDPSDNSWYCTGFRCVDVW